MKSITIISGKGGTGKTIVTASFAALASSKVMADCDVDAADLHLILKPEVEREEVFEGGKAAEIDEEKCISCGRCTEVCRYEAISDDFVVDPIKCEGCAYCYNVCPVDAISLENSRLGRWYISNTEYGPMVHARLGIAEENSGKLVAIVRQNASEIAKSKELEYIIVDGPPGIGCPVIASITGSDLLLIVTEPTVSGLHDLQRVMSLAKHFDIKTLVCVNKYDLNVAFTDQMQEYCEKSGVGFVGRIPFDIVVTKAVVNGEPVVEYSKDSEVSKSIRRIWQRVEAIARER